jgi:hypothetical protein
MRNKIIERSLFILLILSISILYFLFIKEVKRCDLLNEKIIELEAKERVAFFINTYSELSYPQILNSLGKLEEMLVNKGMMQKANSEGYRNIFREYNSLKDKFDMEDLEKIPNYHELTKPYIIAVVVKSYQNVMLDLGNGHFKLTIKEFNKYLKGEPDINLDHLFVNIDKMNVEGDLLRLFLLLQIIQDI